MYPLVPKKLFPPLPDYILTKLMWILCGVFIAAFIKTVSFDKTATDNRVWLGLVIIIFAIMMTFTSKRTDRHR
jgi:hypothetical protein